MADLRNILRIEAFSGDRLGRDGTDTKLSIIDDKLEKTTGLLNRVIPNDSVEIDIDFTLYGLVDVRYLLMYATGELAWKFNATGNVTMFLTPPTDLPLGDVITEEIILAGALAWRTRDLTNILVTNSGTKELDLFIIAAGL